MKSPTSLCQRRRRILRFISEQCLVSCNCSLLGIARNGGHQTVFARTACCPSITRACVRARVRACRMPGRMTACYATGAPGDGRSPRSSPIRRPEQCVIRPPSVIYLLHTSPWLPYTPAPPPSQTIIRCKSL